MIIGAHWTWLALVHVVNEAHFGVNRFFQPSYPGDCANIGQPSGETGINWGTPANLIPQTGEPANCGMPAVTIQGFTATGCCNSFPKIQGPDYTTQGIDNVSYIQGKHSLKFGGEVRHESTQGRHFIGSRGTFTFANAAGGLTGLQQFLKAHYLTSTLPSELVGTPDVKVTDWGFALYAQDDWRMTPRFTLNLGVRFERVTPIQENNNQLANFDPNSATGLVQIGQTAEQSLSCLEQLFAPFRLCLGYQGRLQVGCPGRLQHHLRAGRFQRLPLTAGNESQPLPALTRLQRERC